jgi:galactosamine-6-phosphate isomerase
MATIHRCRDYGEMSRRAAGLVVAAVEAKSDALLCLTTGHSPAGLYQELAGAAVRKPDLFADLQVVKLDEWLGVPASDPNSCEHFLNEHVLGPLGVEANRYISFDAAATEPAAECARVSESIARRGPIDLCILGLGKNGHLGLNEPGPGLQPHCHVATLAEMTRQHPMFDDRPERPRHGLTLGIGDLLKSRRILLLITGKGKAAATAKFLEGRVTTEWPVSFLWLHPHVDVLLDESGGT